MKIFEYRFSKIDENTGDKIAEILGEYLEGEGDIEFWMIENGPAMVKNTPINTLRLLDFSETVKSISKVFNANLKREGIDWNDYYTLKSKNTCRFIDFEWDGLMRLCMPENTDVQFDGLTYEWTDASHLLIETDFWDFF